MSLKCPRCGAEFLSAQQCRDRFDLCMAKEFENPATYGSVHHLTVGCYMLQHNEYSRDVWLEARNMIAQFIREGIPPTEMRRRNRIKFDNRERKWSVNKGPKLLEFDTIVWSRTIADLRLDNFETYCADVKLWALSVLTDTETLIKKLSL